MRKGFTIVELLFVLMTIPALMLVTSGLFKTLVSDAPGSWKEVQQNTTVLNALEQIHQDIDKAVELPESYEDYTSNSEFLLIKQTNHLIVYQLEEGSLTRRQINTQQNTPPEIRSWLFPDAEIQWRILRKNNKGYAVEIQNYIESKRGGRLENKLENSHLYFIGVL
jgi:type II secretory pathway pseudopilin PulG